MTEVNEPTYAQLLAEGDIFSMAPETLRWLIEEEDRFRAEYQRTVQSWNLALAVGNGTALLGVSAMLFADGADQWRPVFIGTAWVFAIGLLFAGALTPLRASRYQKAAALHEVTRNMVRTKKLDPLATTHAEKLGRIKKTMELCENVATATFVAGLVGPLICLTMSMAWK